MKKLIHLFLFVFCFLGAKGQYCNHAELFTEPIASNADIPTFEALYTVYGDGCQNPNGSSDCNIYIQKPNDHLNASLPLRPTIIGVHGYCYAGEFWEPLCNQLSASLFSLSLVNHYTQYGFTTASIQYRQSIEGFSACATPVEEVARTHYRTIIDIRTAVKHLYEHAEEFHIDRNNIFLLGNSQGGMGVLQAAFLEDENEFFDKFPQYDYLIDELGPLPPRVPIKGVINIAGFVYALDFLDATDIVPLFLGHGVCDDIVPYDVGMPLNCMDVGFPEVYGSLQIACRAHQLGIPYSLHTIQNMGHAWPENVVEDAGFIVRAWAKEQIICGLATNEQHFYDVGFTDCPHSLTIPQEAGCISTSSSNNFISKNTNIKIFPNPFNETIFLENKNCFDCTAKLSIYPLNGKAVLQKNFSLNQSIDLSFLRDGMYILELKMENKVFRQKIIAN